MTVSEWFQERQGQSLLVPGANPENQGQCVQAADYALNEIYGLPYVWLNAIDWWNQFSITPQLANNFYQVTDGSIKAGDFVIFNQKVGSPYGHIDIALQDGTVNNYIGVDSNWAGNKTVHSVNHSGQSEYIIGALRLKGDNMTTISNTALQDYENWKEWGIKVQNILGNVGSWQAIGGDINQLQPYLADLIAWKKQGMEQQTELANLKNNSSTVNKDSVIKYISENLS